MLSKFLINKGITHIFGYVGGANLPLINQFVNCNLKFKFSLISISILMLISIVISL